MFISVQSVLAVLVFGMISVLALGITTVGYSRLGRARAAGEADSPATMAWLVCGIWALFVLGFAVAIALGIAGYGVLEGVTQGGGGD